MNTRTFRILKYSICAVTLLIAFFAGVLLFSCVFPTESGISLYLFLKGCPNVNATVDWHRRACSVRLVFPEGFGSSRLFRGIPDVVSIQGCCPSFDVNDVTNYSELAFVDIRDGVLLHPESLLSFSNLVSVSGCVDRPAENAELRARMKEWPIALRATKENILDVISGKYDSDFAVVYIDDALLKDTPKSKLLQMESCRYNHINYMRKDVFLRSLRQER